MVPVSMHSFFTAPLEKGDKILAHLASVTASVASPEQVAELSTDQKLDELEPLLDKALEDRDEDQVRSITSQAQDLLITWHRRLLDDITDTKNQYEEELKKFGPDSETTQQLAAALTGKESTLLADEVHIGKLKRHFDSYELIRAMHEGEVASIANPIGGNIEPLPPELEQTKTRRELAEECIALLQEKIEAYHKAVAEAEKELASAKEIASKAAESDNLQKAAERSEELKQFMAARAS